MAGVEWAIPLRFTPKRFEMFGLGMRPEGLVIGSRRVHYAWVIVGVATVMWMTSSSMRFAVAVLVPEFDELFGWTIVIGNLTIGTITVITAGFTIQWLMSAAMSPLCGWLSDRYGVRRVMWGGAVLFMAGMVMTGIMNSWWEFYLYFGLLLAAGMASFQVTLVSGVTLWFRRNLGLAMGILQGLQGLATAFLIGLVYLMYENFGLQATFWIPGIAGGVILLTLTNWFYNEPADRGITQFGAPADEPVRRLQNNAIAKLRTHVFFQQVQRTGAFWNLSTIHGLGCAGHNIILILLVAIAIEDGISAGMAATVYLVLTLVSTATRFATPVIADLVGSKGVMGVCFALQTLPILILFVAGDSLALYFVFAVLVRHRNGRRNVCLPHHQPPVLRRRAHGNGLRLADDGRRVRHGPRARGGGSLARHHRSLLLASLAVLRPQHPGSGGHHVPAQHQTTPVASLGGGPAARGPGQRGPRPSDRRRRVSRSDRAGPTRACRRGQRRRRRGLAPGLPCFRRHPAGR